MIKQAGLTLIEVLIASIILFMTLGVAASFFQQQVQVQRQAQRYVRMAAEQNNVINRIQLSFMDGVDEGEIILGSTNYRWKSTLVSQGQQFGGASEGATSQGPRRVSIYEIEVLGESASATYQFRLVRWNDKVG